MRVPGSTEDSYRGPPWPLVLSYEFQIRKLAARKILYEGLDIASALIASRKCTETKEKYFISPMALSFAQGAGTGGRAPKRTRLAWQPDRAAPRGHSSNFSGGKGAGKGPSRQSGMHSTTPDGRKICFRWNTGSGNCKGACGFVHCCQRCFKNHPAVSCGKSKDKDTQPDAGPATVPAQDRAAF